MISGGSKSSPIDISKYLVNFNASDWANQANQYLTNALNQGINQSTAYTQQAVDAQKAYQQQANQAQVGGFEMSQALNAPQRMATYGALDAYQDTLGLSRPQAGGYQLASQLENQARQQAGLLSSPVNPQQIRPQQGLFQQGGNQ